METMQKTVLRVGGMHCQSCVNHISSALIGMDGVCAVDVRLREGRVTVEHRGPQSSVTSMIEVLREAGYESSPEAQAA
jgi:copper chaperone CopZ